MNKKYNIKLEWNNDHYDVYIVELGEGVKATGKDREEALRHGNEAISKFNYEREQAQKQVS